MTKKILVGLSMALLISSVTTPVRADCMKAYEDELNHLKNLEDTDNATEAELRKMQNTMHKWEGGGVGGTFLAGCIGGALYGGIPTAGIGAAPGCGAGILVSSFALMFTGGLYLGDHEIDGQEISHMELEHAENHTFANRLTIEEYRRSVRNAYDLLREARDYFPQGGTVTANENATALVGTLKQGNLRNAFCDKNGVATDREMLALAVKSAESSGDARVSTQAVSDAIKNLPADGTPIHFGEAFSPETLKDALSSGPIHESFTF
jgi:hypothetical protein